MKDVYTNAALEMAALMLRYQEEASDMLRSLVIERDELKDDAERYRWLRYKQHDLEDKAFDEVVDEGRKTYMLFLHITGKE